MVRELALAFGSQFIGAFLSTDLYTSTTYLIGDISTVDGHECFSRLDDIGYDRGPVDVVF
jgi:hypothetical protein